MDIVVRKPGFGTSYLISLESNMFFKGYPLEAKTSPKSVRISWARLAGFCHLGVISDTLIVSKFHNETHDPKVQENKIYNIVKGRETFYRRHTVPVTSCSEVKYILKRVSSVCSATDTSLNFRLCHV